MPRAHLPSLRQQKCLQTFPNGPGGGGCGNLHWVRSTNLLLLVTQSCLTLCDPMDCSTPGLPVHHQLPESTQTHVHCVGDAIQPSHPLLSPTPPASNLSQLRGLFQWLCSSHWMGQSLGASASASVLPLNIQGWFPLRLTALISLLSKGLSRVFSSTTVQRHKWQKRGH